MDSMQEAVELLRAAKRVVVFSGAGISAESGIPTFRDGGGLWDRFPPERFANWNGLRALMRDSPEEVLAFLLAVAEPVAAAQPHDGHRALARLEARTSVTVVTQNIDALHQEAGSSRVWEVHGTLFEVERRDGKRVPFTRAALRAVLEKVAKNPEKYASVMDAVGLVEELTTVPMRQLARLSVVMFGDLLREPDWTEARRAVQQCDLLLVVGTSAVVWPAGELPELAQRAGAKLLVVDPAPWSGTRALQLKGTAKNVLPELVDRVLR